MVSIVVMASVRAGLIGVAAAVCLAVVGGCADDEAPVFDLAGADVGAVVDSGVVCCPVDPPLTCGCVFVGGTAPEGDLANCARNCDGRDYTMTTDDNGCARAVSGGSCFDLIDAGSPTD